SRLRLAAIVRIRGTLPVVLAGLLETHRGSVVAHGSPKLSSGTAKFFLVGHHKGTGDRRTRADSPVPGTGRAADLRLCDDLVAHADAHGDERGDEGDDGEQGEHDSRMPPRAIRGRCLL